MNAVLLSKADSVTYYLYIIYFYKDNLQHLHTRATNYFFRPLSKPIAVSTAEAPAYAPLMIPSTKIAPKQFPLPAALAPPHTFGDLNGEAPYQSIISYLPKVCFQCYITIVQFRGHLAHRALSLPLWAGSCLALFLFFLSFFFWSHLAQQVGPIR